MPKTAWTYFFSLVLFAATCAYAGPDPVLCVDVGGTRTKAAVILPPTTIEDLKNISVIAFSSSEWLNNDPVKLFDPHTDGSLVHRIPTGYKKISISITGIVWNNAVYFSPFRPKVPKYLKSALQQQSDMPIFVENDVVNWFRGALYWQDLRRQHIEFPCLCLTLGTGAGTVVALSPDEIVNIHQGDKNFIRKRVLALVEKQTGSIPQPRSHIGKSFFDWVSKEHPDWNEGQIRTAYVLRVQAFLQDMQEYLRINGIEVKTLFVGGGNSRFLSKKDIQFDPKVRSLLFNTKYFEKFQVSPDILSLLGALPITIQPLPYTQHLPTVESLYPEFVP